MKYFFVIICNFVTFLGIGQSRLEKIKNEVSSLCYANKFDEAQVEVLKFIKSPNLTPEEVFYGHFLFADVLKSSSKTNEAIEKLEECKKYLKEIPHHKKHESLILGNIAECYFNLSNYKKANKFALESIEISPDSSFRGNGHAVNFMILGYGHYVAKNFSLALENYNKVIQLYRSNGSSCELPLCYMKIAKVFNSMGNQSNAIASINKAIALSDSCGIENYKLLSKRTLFDIYKENKNYEKALEMLEEINVLVEKLEFSKQGLRISELIGQYKNELNQKDNENLKKINEKNKKIIIEQKRTMFLIVFAGILLCILFFFVIIISRNRKKSKRALEKMNLELELKVKERTKELATDLLIRKRLETKLSDKVREMEILITKLSHDMRSPLSSILGLINVATQEADKNSLLYFEKIKIAIKRLDDIIIDLTSIVYISNMELKPEVVQFEAMLTEIISIMRFREKFDKIKFNININQTKDFNSDPRFIHSIIQNLVENSVKYTGNSATPYIDISISEYEKGIKIVVKDNGIGIEPELHAKIFDMFFRGTEISKGSGLGLYILKKAVNNLHGRIELESQKGIGTTFTIFIPDLNLIDTV